MLARSWHTAIHEGSDAPLFGTPEGANGDARFIFKLEGIDLAEK